MATQSQTGVLVRGPGTSTSDSIPAALSDGELVIPADDVRRFGAAHIMKLVKDASAGLPEPSIKDGVPHAATGGLIENPYGVPTNDVTRVGNSYSGGNVGGSITVNGAAPGGTVSPMDAYKVPPLAAPRPAPVPAPAAAAPAAVPPAAGAPAVPPAAAAPPPAPSGLGVISSAPVQQVRSVFAPPPAPAAAAPAPVPAPAPAPAPAPRLGYATGGLAEEEDLNRAAFGVFPQMPTGGTPAPRALATQAQVRAVDNAPAGAAAIAAAPTAPAPAAPAAATAQTPGDLGPLSARGNVSDLGGWSTPAPDRVAQLNRDASAQRSLSDRALETAREGVGGPTPGMAVIGPVDYANRNADFNDSAQLRTVLARGAAPGRNGAAAFAQQAQGAALPLIQRAQQREADTQQAGAAQRAQLAERGLAARAQMTDARQAEGNSIDRARLGIDAIRAGQSGMPAGYRQRADGSGLEFIPGGPADPDTAKGKNALTEGQSKALLFGSRMQASNKILGDLQAGGKVFSTVGANTPYVGGLVNLVNSEQGQQLDQAKRDFLNATLRRESGAVISPDEFGNGDKQYFPQPGDSPKVIAQKRQNREVAIRGILAEVPNSEQRSAAVVGSAGNAAAPQRAVSRTGVLNGRRVVQYSDGSIEYGN